MRYIVLTLLLLLIETSHSMQSTPQTIAFAQREDHTLEMDIYHAPKHKSNGVCVMYVFGGGFVTGSKDEEMNVAFYKELVGRGYTVVAFDYRLALQGVEKVGVFNNKVVFNAVDIATEDLFSALAYLIEHDQELGIDISKIALVGSSAGAITSLQADYYLANRSKFTEQIPDDFSFSAVVSLAGSLFSREGKPQYKRTPAPTLMMHGTKDKVVVYNKIQIFKLGMFGTHALTKIFEKSGFPYQTMRFKDAKHEVAEFPREYYLDHIDNFLLEASAGEYTNQVDITIKDRFVRENLKLELTIKDLYNGN